MPTIFGNPVDSGSLLYDTDSYKHSHHAMQRPGATRMSFYIEARAPWGDWDTVVFFGLQMELMKLAGAVVTHAAIDEAEPFLRAHGLQIAVDGWRRIVDVHGGRLPVSIHALPEGTLVPVGVPMVRVENTDPQLPWLGGFLETRILRSVWYPSTVASLTRHTLRLIRERRILTDGSDAGAEFSLHDFGARGVSSHESAMIGGCAHLVASRGSDTVPGLVMARNAYGADMAGFSIPATEHSVTTAWERSGELDFYRQMLNRHPTGFFAAVSDSYDLMSAVTDYWGGALRDQVLGREGTLVIRPDSGDPVRIVPDVIEALMARFGHTLTANGYRLLPSQVRVIQGDGIDRFSIPKILDAMVARGLSASNVAFGMGGGLLQAPTRDSFGFAMKASAVEVDGRWIDINKEPVTAGGSKTSKRGRVAVIQRDGRLIAARLDALDPAVDLLRPVFADGEIVTLHRFEDVRARAA